MSEAQTESRRGTVKFYIDEKLFGFLIDEETGEEVHVPVAGLIDEIKKNDKVSYRIESGKKGPEAVDVRVLKR
ncbi:MAG: cold-shock protein [Cryomorphaceae bacterium]